MSRLPRPSYLAVVPPVGRPFRRPKRQPPLPVTRDDEAVSAAIRQAEHVHAIAERLHRAASANDEIVVRALADRIEVEARYAANLASRLREAAR